VHPVAGHTSQCRCSRMATCALRPGNSARHCWLEGLCVLQQGGWNGLLAWVCQESDTQGAYADPELGWCWAGGGQRAGPGQRCLLADD
jgi:hypothetical protein